MHAAQLAWDSATVIELGLKCVADIKICRYASDALQHALEMELYDHLARAFSRQANSIEALKYYDIGAVVCESARDFPRLGRTLCCKADAQMSLHLYDAAKTTYTKVHKLGEEGGWFEIYAKACLGLSSVARLEGDMAKALELSHESLTATGLMEEGQYGKKRDSARAIIGILKCSDMYADDLDESLLDRLVVLGTEIDLDLREGGGSLVCVEAADFLAKRHMAKGRLAQGANACNEVIRLASEDRFRQTAYVQSLSDGARQMLINLQMLNLVVRGE